MTFSGMAFINWIYIIEWASDWMYIINVNVPLLQLYFTKKKNSRKYR